MHRSLANGRSDSWVRGSETWNLLCVEWCGGSGRVPGLLLRLSAFSKGGLRGFHSGAVRCDGLRCEAGRDEAESSVPVATSSLYSLFDGDASLATRGGTPRAESRLS